MPEPAPPPDRDVVAALRLLAVTSLVDAIAGAERALEHQPTAEVTYLLAELYARAGRAVDSLPLIDRARVLFQEAGRDWEAERCEVGRVAVLDDLGRHGEAVEVATRQIARLEGHQAGSEADDLLVRVRSNRALCFETMGRYLDAIDDHDAALQLAGRLGDEMVVAQLQINRSNVLNLLGRSDEAIDGLTSAVAILDAQGSREDRAKVAINIGTTHSRRGEYDQALAWFRVAEDLVEPGTDDDCGIQVEAGDALQALGALDQARVRYRAALGMMESNPLSWLEGRALMGAGVTAGQLGEQAEARRDLVAARAAFDRAGNRPWSTWSTLELAALDPGQAEPPADTFERLATFTDTGEWPVQASLCHLRLAELIERVDPSEQGRGLVEYHLRQALELVGPLGMKPLSYRVHHRVGVHLLSDGRVAGAAPHIELAASMVESMRGGLGHLALLRSFPVTTASVFDALVELRLAQGDIERAWDAADGARSRSLFDVATGRIGLDAAVDGQPHEGELHAIYDQLLNPDGLRDRSARAALESRARIIEEGLDAADVTLAPPSVPAPRWSPGGAGRSDRSGLMFHTDHRGTIGLFVGHGTDVEFLPGVATVAEVTSALDAFHAGARRAYAVASAGREVPAAMVAGARAQMVALGKLLLDPVRDLIDRSDSPLRIIPVGVLHAVPFAALELDGAPLVERRPVVTVPSARIDRQLAGRSAEGDAVVAVGVTAVGLAGVATELAAVRSAWPEAQVLLDHEATRDRTAAVARGARLLHLASHGAFRSTSALNSGIRLADGWLTARDVMRIGLPGTLVVLSACDTGRVTASAGDELLGLQYGFLAAGARNLVISLWAAHDASAVAVMSDFHRHLAAGVAPVDALRRAQLSLRELQPHPWWWAPFQFVGPT